LVIGVHGNRYNDFHLSLVEHLITARSLGLLAPAGLSVPRATVTSMDDSGLAVRLEAWTDADLGLLRQANTPEMMAHLGGPETEAKLLDRHQRYLRLTAPGAGQMMAVVLPGGRRAGIIGYWEREWRQETVYERGSVPARLSRRRPPGLQRGMP
jgi:hypothetical protein